MNPELPIEVYPGEELGNRITKHKLDPEKLAVWAMAHLIRSAEYDPEVMELLKENCGASRGASLGDTSTENTLCHK